MKRIIATIAAFVSAAAMLSAQEVDLASTTELYNSGAEAYQLGEKATALKYFQSALAGALQLGDEGADLAADCKNLIPQVSFGIAKDLINEAKYDEAVEALNAAVAIAKEYGADDVATDAANYIPKVYMSMGGTALNAKNYAAAAEAYRKVLEITPADGVAALRLGTALKGAGDMEGAIAAFDIAKENGQQEEVAGQLKTIYLKQASEALKAKKYDEAIELAGKVNEIAENAQAYQIAAQAANNAGKVKDAIAGFEKYLELAPTAKNASQITYLLGTLYQKDKNNAKAKECYNKVLGDAKYGAYAQKALQSLK